MRLAGGMPLAEAVVVADPRAWLALDEAVRVGLPYHLEGLPQWEQAAQLPADLSLLDEPRLALALCHRDGWTREAALEPAARYPDLLPLVVLRCADWVAPVRERARKVLREVLDPGAAVTLAPLILLLGRRDQGAFATELLAVVFRGVPRERLACLYSHADRTVRRFAYRLAVEQRLLSPGLLAQAAARDFDTVVQNLCADAALAAMTDEDPDDVIRPLLTARNPRVRSAGVTALRRAGRVEQSVEFLADRAGLVRACARYVVRQYGGDPLSWYRERCAERGDPTLPPGAVAGLAECGERGDAEVLWSLVRHPAAGVRAQAVAGLRVLDAADARRLSPLLDDPAPGVVREVTAAVLPSAGLLPEEWLVERLGAGWPRPVRIAAFRLLAEQGGAAGQRALIALRGDPDEELRQRATRAVRR
ncbi:hypothetical protein G9272_13705 [Streptomyces asoensis]|uniref:PBS lyase n=1 Tax=Streptomyces asoensis TaxID=249586 RepID=A0A6M4X563_9ACTN|nr:hypothetical protein G9272_13705 [Streptomyces asoensis]